MADAPERIWAMPARQLCWTEDNTNGIPVRGYYEYVRADLTPPAAVVEAMERALRSISDLTVLSATDFDDKHPDLNAKLDAQLQEHWYDVLSSHADDALAALTAWRDAQ